MKKSNTMTGCLDLLNVRQEKMGTETVSRQMNGLSNLEIRVMKISLAFSEEDPPMR